MSPIVSSPDRPPRRWRRIRAPIIGLTVSGLVAAMGFALGYRVNLTPSEPLGLWRVEPMTASPRRGDFIGFCAPVPGYPFLDRGLCPDGLMPFLKTIVGVPGDRIVETAHGVTVNGLPLPHSRPRRRARGYGTRLPHRYGTFTLAPNEYWTYGTHDPGRSFDSRYWGPIRQRRIRFLARPLWTFGG